VLEASGLRIEGAHENARIRDLNRLCSSCSEEASPGRSLALVEKYSVSALLTISLLSQHAPSCGSPSLDQVDRTKFAVRAARAHRRCLARPGGDHAIAMGGLADISSPIE
jgi:hypothetical protein